jgi:single-stranded-DNA-specific exonuclease
VRQAVSDGLLIKGGGHAMAAGLSLLPDNVDSLRRRLDELARRSLTREQLQPSLRLDAEVSFQELNLERVEELRRLEPVGQGNPPVQVAVRGLRLHRPPLRMGRQQQHARLLVTDGSEVGEVVWWNCAGERFPTAPFDLAVAPRINEYKGARSVQLRLLDWQSSG